MSEYQKIEYIIAKDGKITERVIGGSGSECVSATSALEATLGEVANRELLPEYYDNGDNLLVETENQHTSQF